MTISEPEIKTHDANAAPLRQEILTAFAAVFTETTVAQDDDFFDLGGDSLLAEALAIRLTKIAGKNVRISALFDHPTPNRMREFLAGEPPAAPQKTSDRPPIFMVHGASGYTMPKPLFFEGLAADQRLELLQIPGLSGDKPIPGDIPTIAAAYVEQIEQSWPEGRLHISAFCNGALIALEVKSQLAKRDRHVDHMVLFDPAVPKYIDVVHKGHALRPAVRIGYILLTGRLSGGLSKADVPNRRIRRVRARLRYYESLAKKLRARLTGYKADRFKPDQNLWATSQLYAAVNHYWPDVYNEKVDLICSRQRLSLHEDPSSFWCSILPQMKVWSIMEEHEEVTGAMSSEPAIKMQTLFDQSEGRQG